MTVDLLLRGGRVLPMNDPSATVRHCAVAIAGDRIVAMPSEVEAAALCGPQTRVIDLAGATLLPGFIDSHVHFTQTGLGALGPAVYELCDSAQVLEVVRHAAASAPAGQALLVHGLALGDLERPINGADLDAIDDSRPIMIGDVGAHACVLNTRAMALVNLPADTPGRADDGVYTAQANTRARYAYYSGTVGDEARVSALHRASAMALEVGITTVHALEGGNPRDGRGWLPQRDVEVLLREQSALPVHTVIYFQSTDVEQALAFGLPRIGGCIWVDGAYDEHTAALLQPYCDCQDCSGSLYFSDEALYDFVERAHRAGLQISMHAIGDAAIEQLLNAYERALQAHPRDDHRHRIEHFSLPGPGAVERAARLGVALGMQPNFAQVNGPLPGPEDPPSGLVSYLGYERWQRRHPYRAIVDSGALVAGGSDADPKPMGPLIGIQALAAHPEPERRLSAFEAIELYTINGARIAFQEQDKGTIEVGKLADLVVLAQNPLTADPATLASIPVEMTIVAGRIAYRRSAPHPAGAA